MEEAILLGVGGAGSCSSLASSNSDEQLKANRNSIISATTANPLVGQRIRNPMGNNVLLHSLSTNDASLGEYKYTVNVGQHSIKITGDSIELVRVCIIFLT